jgi:hypothetical protein
MFSLLKVDHSDCKATLRSLVEEPTRLFYGVRDEYFSSNNLEIWNKYITFAA